jgi:hypothetical protein
MADEKGGRSGAEEFVELEIELEKPLDPDQEKNFCEELGKIDSRAFESCDIAPSKIALCYDPTRTNQEELLRAIKQSGGKLKHVEIEISPLL